MFDFNWFAGLRDVAAYPPKRKDQERNGRDQYQQRAEVKPWCWVKPHELQITILSFTLAGKGRGLAHGDERGKGKSTLLTGPFGR
jgi:hypothetical protein